MANSKILDTIHVEVHALRLMPNYKASLFEQKLNRMISEEYGKECDECKAKSEQLKYQPIQPPKKNFIEGMFT